MRSHSAAIFSMVHTAESGPALISQYPYGYYQPKDNIQMIRSVLRKRLTCTVFILSFQTVLGVDLHRQQSYADDNVVNV